MLPPAPPSQPLGVAGICDRVIGMGNTDPIERIIEGALAKAKVRFVREGVDPTLPPLDFYLPDHGLFIEVKQFHSDRIAAQMKQADNVIAIQGRGAALAFADMISRVRR